MKRYVSVFSVLLIGAISAWSQTTSVTGRVTDSSGAVVPDVRVTVTNDGTGVEYAGVTTTEGYFSIPSLPPGKYRLAIDKQGFRPIRTAGLELTVGQVARLDFTLEVGTVAESLEVSARAVLLESETSSLGHLVGGRQITELPLLGRNPYALAVLVPGVRASAGMNNLVVDQVSTVAASINGTRANQNEFLLDGAPNTAPAQNGPILNPNVDSVQEFKVETNAFSAEYGRAAGGVFNVVTKGGTNNLHFTAYEFLRNDKLNANDFFANRAGRAKAPFRFNQFGGTIGGPVVIPNLYNGRNRTFFFASAELVRFSQGITYVGTVPDPSQLAGDFSNLRNAAGQPVTIYDPLTTTRNPDGSFVRQPFAGNRVPADRIDPVARNMGRYWPAPNSSGAQFTGVNNFVNTDANKVDKNTWSARFDHHWSDKNRMYGRYSYDESPWDRAPTYGKDFVASPVAGAQVFTRYNSVLEDSHTFSPSLLGTFRLSWARLSNFRRPFSDGFDITALGLPASLKQAIGDPPAFPVVNITGLGMTGSIPNVVVGGTLGATDLIAFGMDNAAFQASAWKSFSRHNVKTGFDGRVIRFNTRQNLDQSVQFTFGPAFTQGPNPTVTSAIAGSGLATFLLGIPAGSATPSPYLSMQNLYYAVYIQDDWKITPKLTLNLGLRWEAERPRTDRYNQLTNFDSAATPPLTAPGLNLHGALSFVGVNGASRYQAETEWDNFSPRVGFAYQIMQKTVLRGGAGLFYAPTTGGSAPGDFGISGFQASTDLVTSLDGVTPLNYLRNPYPDGLNRPTGSSLGAATLLGQSVSFLDRGVRVPYTGQWNLSIQHELPGALLFQVGYVGTRGLHLQNNLTLNQLPDAALALGNSLRDLVSNPFFGQIKTGPVSRQTVSRAQLLRPYPHFDGVTAVADTFGVSAYHALQAKIEKRFAQGLTTTVSYTYSKMMDDNHGGFGGEPLSGGGFQNWNNRRADWAVSALDQTHRFIANAVYELPFRRDQKGVLGRFAGGWELGAILSFFSGGPLGIGSAVNNTFSQGGGQRPNWNGVSGKLDNPTPDRWFDTSVFSAAPAYTFGNAPRTFGGSRYDGANSLDLSLIKNTTLKEKLRLQFRAEFFNLTNTPQFGPPNTVFGSPQFGIVAAQANQPRIIQFALKLLY